MRPSSFAFTSISQRFLIWFLLVSLLPILVIGYSLLHTFETELQQAMLQQISVVADKKVNEIDSYLDERIQDASVKMQSNTVRNAMEEFTQVFASGVESAAYRRLDSSYRDYFQRFVVSAGYYDLFLISPQGLVVYSQTHEPDFATNLFTGPYRNSGLAKVAHNALQTMEYGISEFELYAPSGNAAAAFIAVPVMVKGRPIGVLALQIDNARVFQVLLDNTGMGESGETVVARLESEHVALVMAPLKLDADAMLKRRIELDTASRAAAPLLHALNGERGSGQEIDYSGQPVLAAWRYLPILRAGMVVKMDVAEALAPYYRVRNFCFAVLALAFFATLVAALMLGRRVVSPLKKLNIGAQDFAAGKLGQRVHVGGRDELGQLADSFNRMAERLQSSYSNLEEQIQQRTRELSQSLSDLRIKDAAIASSINAIAIAGVDGRIFYVNQAFVDLWRLHAPEDAIGRSPVEFLVENPEQAQTVMESLQKNGRWQGEVSVRLEDGRQAELQLSASMVRDENGKPLCTMASFLDITARKTAEWELQKSEALLESLIDNMPAMVFVKRALDLRFEMFNRAGVALLGFAEHDLLGKNDYDFFPREQADFFTAKDREVLSSHQLQDIPQESIVTRNGETRILHTRKIGIYNEAGEATHLLGVSVDITEQKRAEAALLLNQEQLNEAQRIAQIGSWELDLVKGELIWSDEIFRMFEIDKAQFGATYEAFLNAIHPDDRDKVNQAYTHSLETRTPYEITHRLLMSDGRIKWVNEHCETAFDAEGKPLRSKGTVQDISERMRTEVEYQTVLKSVMDCFWICNLQGRFMEVNDAYCKVMGYSREALLGMGIPDVEALEKAEDTRAHIEKLISTGAGRFETVHRHKDGHLLNFEVSANYLADGGGRIVVFLRDITERKHSEQVLAQSEALFRTLAQVAPVGIFRTDAQGRNTYVNIQYCQIAGRFPKSALGSGWSEAIHPDDRQLVFERWNESVKNNTPFMSEHRFLHPDGKVVWAVVQSRAEMTPDGEILGYVGTVTDITERKHDEEQLRVAAVTFEMHEAIMITDADARIIRVNQAFIDITGYSPEEVVGKNPRILSSGRQDMVFYAEFWQRLLSTGSWSGEIWDKRKNGQIYPKWLTITAVKNREGEISEYVSIFSDITARKHAEEEIRNLAFYDSLTRLPNRRLLLDRFRLALTVSARSNHYGAVMFLDMDRFKTLNDTLGHDYGDLLLIDVARRIQSCVREMDTVARLGGDEFIVLIEEVDENAEEASQKASLIAEKIRAALSAPYMLKDHEYHSSPSIGVSLYCGSGESVDALLKHADLAMYQAKDSGRNAVRFFDPMMQQAVENRAALEADLRGAVAKKQMHLYYQIQIDNEHRALGAEALIRWVHPKRGMVSPAQFIPVAEESALILEIGHWVIETACKQLAQWGKNLQTRHLLIAVNVSAQQFARHDFVETVATTLRFHHVEPSRLKLELTESMVLQDVADVVQKMHALKALGVKLAMDDFGTGYSSLSYLKQLPLDQIKIDQSFVRDVINDPNDAVLVQTIIDMGKNFRLNVIAEGVETEAQLDFLRQHGCMAYQGYLFSKPVPIEQFEKLLDGYA